MITSLSQIKAGARATVIALGVGAGSATVPAHGQEEPLSSYSLTTEARETASDRQGDAPLGSETDKGSGLHGVGASRSCLVDREIRRGLNTFGFKDVDIRRSLGGHGVEVHAVYGPWIYGMRVERCTGLVDGIERVRRAKGGGFGLHFEYGG